MALDAGRCDSAPHRPCCAAVIRRVATSLTMANVVPGVLFYVALRATNVWCALGVALAWCCGNVLWRLVTRRPMSGVLILTLAGLTAKTVFAFVTGSTFVYFVQPAITDAVFAVIFAVSLATSRPFVSRLASDFYPMTPEVSQRPRVVQLFRRLTAFWALISVLKSALTVWLLESLSTVNFVAVKGLAILAILVLGAAATLTAAIKVARRENLLGLPA